MELPVQNPEWLVLVGESWQTSWKWLPKVWKGGCCSVFSTESLKLHSTCKKLLDMNCSRGCWVRLCHSSPSIISPKPSLGSWNVSNSHSIYSLLKCPSLCLEHCSSHSSNSVLFSPRSPQKDLQYIALPSLLSLHTTLAIVYLLVILLTNCLLDTLQIPQRQDQNSMVSWCLVQY